jgi:hypothetical protein
MGAWGAGPFENDSAMDWVWDLEETGWKAVREALAAVLGSEEADADDASNALAATEVVAAALGSPRPDLPETVTTWVAAHGAKVTPDLARDAYQAAVSVALSSELAALWDESGEPQEWRDAVVDVQKRLAGASGQEAGDLFPEA